MSFVFLLKKATMLTSPWVRNSYRPKNQTVINFTRNENDRPKNQVVQKVSNRKFSNNIFEC